VDWHARYLRQAEWTRALRLYLFERAGLAASSRVLEVGCGTGAILGGLTGAASLHGLDLDPAALAACRINVPAARLVRGDALSLPFASASFDIVTCHFLLLWVKDPVHALREMGRAARPGGHVLALAEPDHTARIDRPTALEPLGRWQADALARQGADPGFGGRLAEAFTQAGLDLQETGRIQSRPPAALTPSEWASEWEVLEADLAGFIPAPRLEALKAVDREAWSRGERVMDIPTFFAWGKVAVSS